MTTIDKLDHALRAKTTVKIVDIKPVAKTRSHQQVDIIIQTMAGETLQPVSSFIRQMSGQASAYVVHPAHYGQVDHEPTEAGLIEAIEKLFAHIDYIWDEKNKEWLSGI